MIVMRHIKLILILASALIFAGCSTLAQRSSTGVVVARRAQIRSSTAVVAADLLQVNRGDELQILESTDVQDPSDNTKKERWFRVKAYDGDATEGWIEARNVMTDEVLESAKESRRRRCKHSGSGYWTTSSKFKSAINS